MTKKLILFALLITVNSIVVQSQKDYAVSTKGDTLRGELKMYSMDNLDRLQIKANSKKTQYTSLQIKSVYKDGISYQSVRLDKSYRFMKVVKSGYLSLFQYSSAGQSTWDMQCLVKKDGSSIDVPNLAFKKIITKYLSDCPEVCAQIDKGQLAKKDLERIVDAYNTCIQTKTDAVVRPAASIAMDKEKMDAIQGLTDKVEAENFLTKKDVLDLLKDMKEKISKGQPVPSYLIDGLKSYLADTPSLAKEAEQLATLLKK